MLQLNKPYFNTEEAEAVRKVLESGWLAEGPVTSQFETAVARYVGAKYAVAFCNCTVAMESCLKAYSQQRGFTVKKKPVNIPDFTHPATALAVINAGAHPVLCDVSLETYNINGIEGCTPASIPVSWGGHPLTWVPHSLIVEDAACSLGSSYKGKRTGSEWTCCFSFHPRKIVTTGEGAVVTTNDRETSLALRSIKKFGRDGSNYKFNDVLAAIGIVQMRKLDEIIKNRREKARVYSELLSDVDGVRCPHSDTGVLHTYQTYGCYLERGNRDTIISSLAKKGIETQIGTYALHLMPQFNRLKRSGKLENSTLLYKNLLSLPMAHDLTEEDQKRVVDALKHELA